MQDKFKKWLIHTKKSKNTAYSYAISINNISHHYSQNESVNIDIYKITDINLLSKISKCYSQTGKYKEFGNKGAGTKRNAIARYVEFFTWDVTSTKSTSKKDEENLNNKETQNFSYEKDLQISLCSQISELFPQYKIYGENSEGIEYSIENRRIDVLLENIETNDLMVVELKAGVADYKVYGQIAMYIGLLQNNFKSKNVSGVIIAGAIDDSLKQAASISSTVDLRTYFMKIKLEEA